MKTILIECEWKKRRNGRSLPTYQSAQASGLDLEAAIEEPLTLKHSEFKSIPTGLAIALPDGYEAQVRPRSGLAKHHGLSVLNTPGTIDADYRGELEVILINLGGKDFKIKSGDRIAQLVITPIVHARLIEVNALPGTARGAGGFGSTDRASGKSPNE